MTPAASSTGCPNVPGCEQCPEFISCTQAFRDDINRKLNNTIFAGEITFNPVDFIEHGDLLSGVIPA
jgi:hypothetical protein